MKRFNKKAVLAALIGSSFVCSIGSCNAMEYRDQKESCENVTFLYGGNNYKKGFDFEYREKTLKDALYIPVLLFYKYNSNVAPDKKEMDRRTEVAKKYIDEKKEIYVFYRDNDGLLRGYMCLMKYSYNCNGYPTWCVKEAYTYAENNYDRDKAAMELIKALKDKNLCELLATDSSDVNLIFGHVSLHADDHIKDAWKKNFNNAIVTWNKKY